VTGRTVGRSTALLLFAVVLLGVGGCGDSSTDTGGGEEIGVGIAEARIETAPAGTPQRTVLEWWRDVQVNDPEHARALYLEQPTLADLAGQFNLAAGRLDGSVEVVSVKRQGDRALVHADWRPETGKARRVTLSLGRDGGAWKLLDPRFLNVIVAKIQRAEAS
jgi:hypothetical protein